MFDLGALTEDPVRLLELPLFLGLFLVVRGVPALVLYRGVLYLRDRRPWPCSPPRRCRWWWRSRRSPSRRDTCAPPPQLPSSARASCRRASSPSWACDCEPAESGDGGTRGIPAGAGPVQVHPIRVSITPLSRVSSRGERSAELAGYGSSWSTDSGRARRSRAGSSALWRGWRAEGRCASSTRSSSPQTWRPASSPPSTCRAARAASSRSCLISGWIARRSATASERALDDKSGGLDDRGSREDAGAGRCAGRRAGRARLGSRP